MFQPPRLATRSRGRNPSARKRFLDGFVVPDYVREKQSGPSTQPVTASHHYFRTRFHVGSGLRVPRPKAVGGNGARKNELPHPFSLPRLPSRVEAPAHVREHTGVFAAAVADRARSAPANSVPPAEDERTLSSVDKLNTTVPVVRSPFPSHAPLCGAGLSAYPLPLKPRRAPGPRRHARQSGSPPRAEFRQISRCVWRIWG